MLDTPTLGELPLPDLTQLRQTYCHGKSSSMRLAAWTNKVRNAPPPFGYATEMVGTVNLLTSKRKKLDGADLVASLPISDQAEFAIFAQTMVR